ncbi:amiloride-sensitive sodium channel subunit beta-like [Dreissena polymorpha]|uniref:amiloride-sensitive sodium channel subunit beta-like n=1 Tax=Dreissena polymorpha TaxID=45954 RepID=UPI002263B238|nr:amiloride-sensitive sodium channel subunit beta-like [Dreissena polymorpha]
MADGDKRSYRNGGHNSDIGGSVDSKGKKKSFRRLLSRFAEKTSMVGVPYINNAKLWWAKLIWCFLLLCALGAMSLHLWYLIDQFFSWPTVTKVELGFSDLRFPRITVCNVNVLHKGRLNHYAGADKLKELVDKLKPENVAPNQYDPDWDPYGNTGTTPGNKDPTQGTSNGNQSPTQSAPTVHQGRTQRTPTGNQGSTQSAPTGNLGHTQRQGTQTDVTETSQNEAVPNQRRKRLVDTYGDIDPSKYDPNKPPSPPPLHNEYDGEKDSQEEIELAFRTLYMNIRRNERVRLGHNITDMLLSCTFNGRVCDAGMFRLHGTPEYGNCWTLDNDKFTVMTPGPEGGLKLVLYMESMEYLQGITTGYGARIQVHEPGTYPYPVHEGMHVPASMETSIGLKLVTVERLNGTYGDCEWGADFQAKYGVRYTRRSCYSACVLEDIVSTCGCHSDDAEYFAQRLNDSLGRCESKNETACQAGVERRYETMVSVCPCPNPCNETVYVKSVSQRQWPTDDYARVLLQGVCEMDLEKCKNLRMLINDERALSNSFLRLNIYYEDLNYEMIKEYPEIEWQQFLSDVGGAIGLWIGLSILSLCEVAQLLVELCNFVASKAAGEYRRSRKHRRKQDHSTSSANDQRNNSDLSRR